MSIICLRTIFSTNLYLITTIKCQYVPRMFSKTEYKDVEAFTFFSYK